MSSSFLFTKKPTIFFRAKNEICLECDAPLQVQKTRVKPVATLHIGEFKAHETVLKCPLCKRVYLSEELRFLVPKYCKFGYDVLAYVGKAAFLRFRTINEITAELKAKNVSISGSEVSYLAKKFIIYLALAHKQIAPNIKKAIEDKGGYILHLDGTCEAGSPHLISALDGISDFVLANVKIPTENAQKIIPLLQNVKENYDRPRAIVTDMGVAMLNSVAEVFPKIPNYICHFHFLRDIGKDLLSNEYDLLRKRLKRHGASTLLHRRARFYKEKLEMNPQFIKGITTMITNKDFTGFKTDFFCHFSCYMLVLWALDGKCQGNGYGFPFDRSHLSFYQRMNDIATILKGIKKKSSIKLKDVEQLLKDLQPIIDDQYCMRVLPLLHEKIEVFDDLRIAMRITLPTEGKGLNDDGQDSDIKTIEQGVKRFYSRLIETHNNENYQKMIEQIEKYWDKLFADPIIFNTPSGTITLQPQRTNNIMESFFRDMRKDHRRRTGKNSMSKTLQSMLPDTPLIKNIDNLDYMHILLNDRATLEEVFTDIDEKIVAEELRRSQEKDANVHPIIKKFIRAKYFYKNFMEMIKLTMRN